MGWFLYALLGTVLISLYALGTKALVNRKSTDTLSLVIVFKVIAALGALSLALLNFDHISIKAGWDLPVVFVLASLVFGTANVFMFKAYPITEISDISLIGSTQPIMAMMMGAALFGEGLTVNKLAACALCAVGIAILYYGQARMAMTRGHWYALISTVAFAAGAFVDKYLVERISVMFYTGIAFFGVACVVFLATRKQISDLRRVIAGRSNAVAIVCLALVGAGGTYFFMKAYEAGGQASEVTLVFFFNTVLTVLSGALFLKERDRLPQKIAATVLTLIALLLIRH